MQEVIVVLQPVRQHIVRNHAPAPFPHLQHTKLLVAPRASSKPKGSGLLTPGA